MSKRKQLSYYADDSTFCTGALYEFTEKVQMYPDEPSNASTANAKKRRERDTAGKRARPKRKRPQ